ncbi:MAG: phage holin family protein [Myxococcales bacterium]|nr:phage holin family protein [Myxococcales bacterium]
MDKHRASSSSDIRELSTPDLLKGLAEDARRLLAQESLAIKARLEYQLEAWKQGMALMIVGGSAIMLGGFVLVLGFARILKMSLGWPIWITYSGTGALFVLGGIIAVFRGRARAAHAADKVSDIAQQPIEDALWITERKSNNA